MEFNKVDKDGNATVEIDGDGLILKIAWHIHSSGEAFRHSLEIALRHAQSAGISKWLCDMRKINYLEIADQLWLVHDFFTRSNKNQVNQFGCVVTSSYLEIMAGARVYDRVTQDPELFKYIDMEVFMDIDKAYSWLLGET